MTGTVLYETTIQGACHWSLRMRRGTSLRLTDIDGGANVGMLFYNPENLLERYNAPDTLKCQHTFRLTAGNCLYSDMGRIFCSIVSDSVGWHETVCGNSTREMVEQRWGERNYQQARNEWNQNGYDSFLVELTKYGLGRKDMASNLNLFSAVKVDEAGDMRFDAQNSKPGDHVELRFEMDTLVLFHTCPHPLNMSSEYPGKPVQLQIRESEPVAQDDPCLTHCDENARGFENNMIYQAGCNHD